MDVVLLITAAAFQGGFCVAGALYARKTRAYNPFLYTACIAFAALIFFVCYNGFCFRYDPYTVKMALAFSVSYIICSIAEVYSVKTGPVAISSIFFSLSLLIPTFFGVFFWRETIGLPFWIGIALVCGAVVLMYAEPPKKEAKKETPATVQISAKWVLYVLLAFAGNGICSVLQTYHQKTGGVDYKSEFMIIAMAVVVVCNLAISLATKQKIVQQMKTAYIGLLAGVMNAVLNLAVMLLSSGGVIPQSIFFPVISIGSMVLVYGASIVLFKEKLSLFQNIGVVLGVAAIVLLQL